MPSPSVLRQTVDLVAVTDIWQLGRHTCLQRNPDQVNSLQTKIQFSRPTNTHTTILVDRIPHPVLALHCSTTVFLQTPADYKCKLRRDLGLNIHKLIPLCMLHHHRSFTYLLPAPSNLLGSDNPKIFSLACILSTSKPFKSPSLPSNFFLF